MLLCSDKFLKTREIGLNCFGKLLKIVVFTVPVLFWHNSCLLAESSLNTISALTQAAGHFMLFHTANLRGSVK